MGIKAIARPINKVKNEFVKWLKDNNAEDIDVSDAKVEGEKEDLSWDYYMVVSGFIGDILYTVYFQIWEGKLSIDYSDEQNRYNKMSIDEFRQMMF